MRARYRLLLAVLAIGVLGCDDVKTLDNCGTDMECQEAADRHCAMGEEWLCDESPEPVEWNLMAEPAIEGRA